ncbi:unnamed protein product [Ectocarpus sp. 6 AP-2014]
MVRGDGRITYTRRHAYHTKSNKAKAVKTPGGKLVAHYLKKSAKGVHCADASCSVALPGIKHMRPKEYKNLKKRQKTVSRAYGGSLCAPCVRQRVVRAFLIEEQKIVKKVLLEKQKKKKA